MTSLQDIQRGYDAWAAKPHNAKWVRKIDGTPIANDIVATIWNTLRDDGAVEAMAIGDGVLSWLVKHDLADAENEYDAADVIEILNDLAPKDSPPSQVMGSDWVMIPRAALDEIAKVIPEITVIGDQSWRDAYPVERWPVVGGEPLHKKLAGVIRKLHALRHAFDMKGTNDITILRAINTLSTMENRVKATPTTRSGGSEERQFDICIDARKYATRDSEMVRRAARQAGIINHDLLEIDRLREVIRLYGDRQRMSFAPPHLQQTIDDAFAAEGK